MYRFKLFLGVCAANRLLFKESQVFTNPEPGFYDEIDSLNVSAVAVEGNTASNGTPPDDNDVDSDNSDSESNSSERKEDEDLSGFRGDSPSETGKREKTLLKKTRRVPVLPALYTCIIRCCLDKASSVRVRAMYHLASLLSSVEHGVQLCNRATLMVSMLEFLPGFEVFCFFCWCASVFTQSLRMKFFLMRD
ncbi:unnamed protein product [Cylicostephanus goldi]|uniref:Condensin complex subunit 1 C-terminal domain-containing protein n=1 Tax=Cylicostephanus goldi TaxID=71465 RepID=A0A3P6TJR5_CYLGO|nr:unnamed protein product [Cylicostephanus goldi]